MIAPIKPLNLAAPLGAAPAPGGSSPSFAHLVRGAVGTLETAQATANQAIQAASVGKGSVTTAMVAMTHAQMTLDVAVSVEGGAVQAYQTIMNMPLG